MFFGHISIQKSSLQKYRNTEIQKYGNTEIHEIEKYKNLGMYSFTVAAFFVVFRS